MKLSQLLLEQPVGLAIPDARKTIRDALLKSGKKLVVVDDDPTGMQTVQDVNIFMDWTVETLSAALSMADPVFFISVNSRSLNPEEATDLAVEVGTNLRQACQKTGSRILLASRSDSTLRGHFPYEVDALCRGLGFKPDGMIFAPAFIEAGRYTVDDTHWAEQSGELVPVGETEFARDPMFPFKNSDLKAWIVEKTRGAIARGSVRSISLRTVREGGVEAVASELSKAAERVPVVVNAAQYSDLDCISLAIQSAEDLGKAFVYRCSASFLKSRGGFPDRSLLTRSEMVSSDGPGLIVAGSYVNKSSGQLTELLESGLAVGIELRVDLLFDRRDRRAEVERAAALASSTMARGSSAALYTSRKVRVSAPQDFADAGKEIMRALCDVVSKISTVPSYVVAKGGITSIQVAKSALGVKHAYGIGQILPGVPVWRLGSEGRWPGVGYVVFPGNVGDETALLRAVRTLSGVQERPDYHTWRS
jgi:uncharacterized protein YgbK (DUF1537 family)